MIPGPPAPRSADMVDGPRGHFDPMSQSQISESNTGDRRGIRGQRSACCVYGRLDARFTHSLVHPAKHFFSCLFNSNRASFVVVMDDERSSGGVGGGS